MANLRAVEEGETPERALSILEAAESGDRAEELRAMRRRIAVTLDNPTTPARDLAALSRRQIEIGLLLEAIAARELEEGSGVSETPDEEWSEKAI